VLDEILPGSRADSCRLFDREIDDDRARFMLFTISSPTSTGRRPARDERVLG